MRRVVLWDLILDHPMLNIITLSGLVLFKLVKRNEKVTACLHKKQHGEDDWELYE